MDRKSEYGFTLIELVIAIAIIAILISTTVFSVIKLRPDWTLNRAARNLYSHMQMARMGAVKDNANWAVRFNTPGPNQYTIFSSWGPDGIWGTPDDVLVRRVNLADYGYGIQFGFGSATIDATQAQGPLPDNPVTFQPSPWGPAVFNSRGMLASPSGFVYLQNNSNLLVGEQSARAIGAMTSGVIRLVKWFEASQTWN